MSSSTHGLTYAEISSRLLIPRCRGIKANGQRCYIDHEGHLGADGFVHWRDRRITRSGIKRFLMIASQTLLVGTKVIDDREYRFPAWLVRYQRLYWVRASLRALGIQLKPEAWAEDKASLRSMIARSKPVEAFAAERREALAWTVK